MANIIDKQLVIGWAVIKTKLSPTKDLINTLPICTPLADWGFDSVEEASQIDLNPLSEELVQVLPAKYGTLRVELVHEDGWERHLLGIEHPMKDRDWDAEWKKKAEAHVWPEQTTQKFGVDELDSIEDA